MSVNCGIVGLPNVGKSTLFNALLGTIAAEAVNYPFCTIEPNKGSTTVPDHRLIQLAEINKSKKILPTKLEFVDIAGLVKGAHKGEGLGNQFLANIREVDAILHVLRCFEDPNIIHVEENVDPIRDAEIVNIELLISDMNSLQTRITGLAKKSKGNDKEAIKALKVAEQALSCLEKEQKLSSLSFDEEEAKILKSFQLLATKPVLYICNVDEDSIKTGNKYSQAVEKMAALEGSSSIIISSKIESEISTLTNPQEKSQFLEVLGLEHSGLDRIIVSSYKLLNLITFFTSGPTETRGWTIKQGTLAKEAAGTIHSDFQKGFICAEVINYTDLISSGSDVKAKELGKILQQGKDYLVKNGDVIIFRFNV